MKPVRRTARHTRYVLPRDDISLFHCSLLDERPPSLSIRPSPLYPPLETFMSARAEDEPILTQGDEGFRVSAKIDFTAGVETRVRGWMGLNLSS